MSEQVFYFGCIGGPGHYLWDSRQFRATDALGLFPADIDTAALDRETE
jgi:hypothetical protein